ncbi:MAG: crossover junction endodeoxyribonuclease RuvC [Chloroflexi bacterium]|nr:crossover junction endodeoxyribonuclease RuvC [Chloroflexota bacterium]
MSARQRIILGIDPGVAQLGYGIVEASADVVRHIVHGCVTTPSAAALPFRLRLIHDVLSEIRSRYAITDVAVEALFHSRNVRTAMSVSHARGVALVATVDGDTAFAEYTPTDVKMAITGYGAAGKRQVQEMVKLMLSLETEPQPDDAADALAVALCHAKRAAFSEVLARAADGAERPRAELR